MASCVRPLRFVSYSWDELRNRVTPFKDCGGRRAPGTSQLRGQESTPWTHDFQMAFNFTEPDAAGSNPVARSKKINNLQNLASHCAPFVLR